MNTGDDSIAAFNDYTGDGSVGVSIRKSYIINSFDRSINLFHTPYDVPKGIDRKTLENLLDCNPAEPSTHPHAEPSLSGGRNDVGYSECVLYAPIRQ
ncbi:MAG TPA: hypothetical protein VHX61_06155 [Rhizomicrobium sp.]|nr:hypothetical protein [Rhizomicrobium sp.]